MESPDKDVGHYNPTELQFQPVSLTVPADMAGIRLDQALARLLPEFSRNRLATWIKEQRVRLDDCVVTPRHTVWGGEKLTVVPAPSDDAQAFQPEAVHVPAIHADASVLVIDKPAGLVVHPGSGNWSGTLLNGLLYHYPELASVPRAGIVHRLDKDTTGLMVVARTLQAQTELVRQLQARSVHRQYLAVVDGHPPASGCVTAPIGRHPKDRVRMAVVADGREATTHFEVLERYPHHALVSCRLETGRTHQIRVHMQSIGHPLAADPVYGARTNRLAAPLRSRLATFARQALHAARLEFRHPETGQPVGFESAWPEDFRGLIEFLREQGMTGD